jgi:hypothetical protein
MAWRRDAILALRARCFGDTDREKFDSVFWDWEFGRGRSFIDAAQTTHIAIIPTPYRVDGNVVRGGLAVDAMTAPEARVQSRPLRIGVIDGSAAKASML